MKNLRSFSGSPYPPVAVGDVDSVLDRQAQALLSRPQWYIFLVDDVARPSSRLQLMQMLVNQVM
ncbi:hypothetical protein D9619_005111 [Psilocybe cf. subviscida]|uniref:Uncharacterized protein n=1 Tax=Psilocybe cf. subviscida TaxID=2480587 RepID=A0A8H5F8H4_9AGAR|nr:hypothetical protein D9619_005111 [Psilocybe cf. subviscida]